MKYAYGPHLMNLLEEIAYCAESAETIAKNSGESSEIRRSLVWLKTRLEEVQEILRELP